GDNQQRLVEVCTDNLGLLREINGAADDVVSTRLQGCDNCALLIRFVFIMHPVSYGNGIRGFDPFGTEFPFDTALYALARFILHQIPTPGRFRYQATHNYKIYL